MHLRYGLNPQQQPATAEPLRGWPVRFVHGEPSYINLLDVLNAAQLVREAALALHEPVATSFKHVSPAGAAAAGPIDDVMTDLYRLSPGVGALTSAYVRARDSDPKSSYGDIVAVSHEVDAELADLLGRMVSDGIIAPGFAPGTVATLSRKKRGRFLIVEADPAFVPPQTEIREVYGLRLTQHRDPTPIDELDAGDWLSGLTGVSFVSDGALPFRDNVDEARRHGTAYIAEPGGSIRSDDVEAACREYGIQLVRTGLRLFHH